MSFSPEIFNKKLESLQDTQDSIVTISQWVLFHHRHSEESAKQWSTFIMTSGLSSGKRLSLLYLCNDVVQQARHKRKSEFIIQFAKVLPGVLQTIYSSLDGPIQAKVERLISVWEQRSVFSMIDIKEFKRAIKLSKDNVPVGEASSRSSSSTIGSSQTQEKIAPELKHLNNLFNHMTKLVESSQASLTQVGIQSHNYLPQDPEVSDNLPSPKIYISKLNVLEKLCNMANKNIDEIKKDRSEIISQIENLKSLVSSGFTTDESKQKIIASKLNKLEETRNELRSMVEEERSHDAQKDTEQESPTFEKINEDDDDAIPTYEADDSDNDSPPPKRQKGSTTPESGNSTPNALKKSVSFSEDVEIKEYVADNGNQGISVTSDDDNPYNDNIDDDADDVPPDFEAHHKDDLELKHINSGSQSPSDSYEKDSDDYDPAAAFENPDTNESKEYKDSSNDKDNNLSVNDNVLNLLSKLA